MNFVFKTSLTIFLVLAFKPGYSQESKEIKVESGKVATATFEWSGNP